MRIAVLLLAACAAFAYQARRDKAHPPLPADRLEEAERLTRDQSPRLPAATGPAAMPVNFVDDYIFREARKTGIPLAPPPPPTPSSCVASRSI